MWNKSTSYALTPSRATSRVFHTCDQPVVCDTSSKATCTTKPGCFWNSGSCVRASDTQRGCASLTSCTDSSGSSDATDILGVDAVCTRVGSTCVAAPTNVLKPWNPAVGEFAVGGDVGLSRTDGKLYVNEAGGTGGVTCAVMHPWTRHMMEFSSTTKDNVSFWSDDALMAGIADSQFSLYRKPRVWAASALEGTFWLVASIVGQVVLEVLTDGVGAVVSDASEIAAMDAGADAAATEAMGLARVTRNIINNEIENMEDTAVIETMNDAEIANYRETLQAASERADNIVKEWETIQTKYGRSSIKRNFNLEPRTGLARTFFGDGVTWESEEVMPVVEAMEGSPSAVNADSTNYSMLLDEAATRSNVPMKELEALPDDPAAVPSANLEEYAGAWKKAVAEATGSTWKTMTRTMNTVIGTTVGAILGFNSANTMGEWTAAYVNGAVSPLSSWFAVGGASSSPYCVENVLYNSTQQRVNTPQKPHTRNYPLGTDGVDASHLRLDCSGAGDGSACHVQTNTLGPLSYDMPYSVEVATERALTFKTSQPMKEVKSQLPTTFMTLS